MPGLIGKSLICVVALTGLTLANASDQDKAAIHPGLREIMIPSSHDKSTQKAFFRGAVAPNPQPLLVRLHSWSSDYTQIDPLAPLAIEHNWNYIHPDFRGPNHRPEACLSDAVIADIDDAIDYAMENGNVDASQIYVVGASGGGHATLGYWFKSKHRVKRFLSWVPISDLESWYWQSLNRGRPYASDIWSITQSDGRLDVGAAKERSPLFWEVPSVPNGPVDIFVGVKDGHQKSVPISHSIDFFNKLAHHFGYPDLMIQGQTYVDLLTLNYDLEGKAATIGGRKVILKREFPQCSITVFDGDHEILPGYCFERLLQLSGNNRIRNFHKE